jgi:transposase
MSEPVAPPDVSPVPLIVRSRRDPAATRRRWVERMERFQATHLTVAEFCAAEGVSVPAFYQWKRTLAAADIPLSPSTPTTFVPLRIAPANAPAVELVLPGGAVLRFPPGTDPATIAAVVRHLGGDPC